VGQSKCWNFRRELWTKCCKFFKSMSA